MAFEHPTCSILIEVMTRKGVFEQSFDHERCSILVEVDVSEVRVGGMARAHLGFRVGGMARECVTVAKFGLLAGLWLACGRLVAD